MKSFFAACAAVIVCVSTASAAPVNLIANGDFSQGNTGFTSDYLFMVDGPATDDLWGAGVYGIGPSAIGRHPYWETSGDHTGDGTMMLVNGQSGSASTVWRTTFEAEAGHSYEWSAWAKNLCCAPFAVTEQLPLGPSLEFWLDGVFLAPIETDGPGVWGQQALWFAAAVTHAATLEIRNSATAYIGNDFAIDDIYLGDIAVTPEPASMLLLGTGLVGVGASIRRRRAGKDRSA